MASFASSRRHGYARLVVGLVGSLVLAMFVGCGRTSATSGVYDQGEGGDALWSGGFAGASSSLGGTKPQAGTTFAMGAPSGGSNAEAGGVGATDAGGAPGDGGSSAAGAGGDDGVNGGDGGLGGVGGEGGATDPVAPCVLHVKTTGSDANDGSSWNAALATLQGAMRASSLKAAPQVCQVWVAEGTYAPVPWSRDAWPTLRVPSGTEIYGGFLGDEQALAERKGSRARTIVTGIRNGTTERLRPVLTTEGQVRVDQLTIRDGESPAQGGGVVCESGELVLNEVLVTENRAADGGGLLVAAGCSAQVQASSFDLNSAGDGQSIEAGRGAGIANFGGRLVVRGGSFTTNVATVQGGGIYTTGNTDLSDVELSTNTVSSQLGPVAGAAVYAEGTAGAETRLRSCTLRLNVLRGSPAYGAGVAGSALVVTGSQVSENRKSVGGELYGGGIYATGTLTLDDSTLADNATSSSAGVKGGGVYFEQGELRVRHSTFHRNRGAMGAQLYCATGCSARVSALFRGADSARSQTAVYFTGATLEIVNSLFFGDIAPHLLVDAPDGAARVIHSTFLTEFVNQRSTIEHLTGTLSVESSVMSSQTADPNVVPLQILSAVPAALTIEKSDIVGLCSGATSCGSNWDVMPKYAIAPSPANDSIVVDAGGAPLPADWLDLDFDGDVMEPLPVDFDGNPRVSGARTDLGAIELKP